MHNAILVKQKSANVITASCLWGERVRYTSIRVSDFNTAKTKVEYTIQELYGEAALKLKNTLFKLGVKHMKGIAFGGWLHPRDNRTKYKVGVFVIESNDCIK